MLKTFGLSHVGLKRKENQDRYIVKEFGGTEALLAVADGMGGEAGGAHAAQTAVNYLKTFVPSGNGTSPEESLGKLAVQASESLLAETERNPELMGMGTTLTAAYVKDDVVHYTHVGDSRMYLFRDGSLTQLTRDHSFLQELLDEGEISEEEAKTHPMRDVMDQCVGTPDMTPDQDRFMLMPGDRLLICSDGLFKELDTDKISEFMGKDSPIKSVAQDILQAVLDHGGSDNVTMILAENKYPHRN